MKKQLVLIPIKNKELVIEWAKAVSGERHQEAVDSLEYENVIREEWWTITIDGKDYWAFTVDGEAIPSDKTLKINRDHDTIKRDTFDGKAVIGELIVDIEKPAISRTAG